jgi:hypothetical protein
VGKVVAAPPGQDCCCCGCLLLRPKPHADTMPSDCRVSDLTCHNNFFILPGSISWLPASFLCVLASPRRSRLVDSGSWGGTSQPGRREDTGRLDGTDSAQRGDENAACTASCSRQPLPAAFGQFLTLLAFITPQCHSSYHCHYTTMLLPRQTHRCPHPRLKAGNVASLRPWTRH